MGREKKLDKVFNALVKLTQNLQEDRQFLEGDIKFLHGVIYKMKMEQKVESLKAELMLGSMEREACIYKHRYAETENDLADFREFFDYLSQKCSGLNDVSTDVIDTGESSRNMALQGEVLKLKSDIEICKKQKESEISALLAEKNFVWNQLKELEDNFDERLKKKCDEVEHANEKVQILVKRAEELQLLNEKLRNDLTKIESESVHQNEEVLKLKKENELLKSRLMSASPLLHPCRTAATSSRRGKNSTTNGSGTLPKKDSDPSQTIEKTTRTRQSAHKSTGGKAPKKQLYVKGNSSSSKSKEVHCSITTPAAAKLFTSAFKVPKLKSSSSPHIASAPFKDSNFLSSEG